MSVDRTNWFATENITTYDLVQMSKDPLKGIGWLVGFILGQLPTTIWGFGASQTVTPSLSVRLNEGLIYALAPVDATPVGALAADSYQVIQQGWTDAQDVQLNTSGLSAGQSQWWLIQCEFKQRDIIRPGDPWAGKRGFYNSTDPSNPLDGINGLGAAIPTVRQGFAEITAKAGAAATTGAEVPPSPDSGCVPVYLIKLSHGQTTILTEHIQTAGPSAYAGYPDAPFIAGLLNAHHKGTNGNAPQIMLNGDDKEVQGVAELVNLPVTNNEDETALVPTVRWGNGTPVGSVAGKRGDFYIDLDSGDLWRCLTAGTAGTAVWSMGEIGTGGVTVIDTFPATITAASGTFALKLSSADGVVNLPSSAQSRSLRLIRYDATHYDAILTPATGAEKVYRDGIASNNMKLRSGEACNLETIPADSRWLFS